MLQELHLGAGSARFSSRSCFMPQTLPTLSLCLALHHGAQAGIWPYVCTVPDHSKMKGVIEVVDRERTY